MGWYSNQGILDTTKIKSKSILVRLFAVCGDMMIKVDYPLKNAAKEEEWVDVKVDRNNKVVDITWRLSVKDSGTKGSNPELSQYLIAI